MSSLELESMMLGRGNIFPHPFFDISSQYMPTNIKDALKWAEWMYVKYGAYRSATNNIVSYGVTTLQLGDEKTETTEKYTDLLEKNMHIKSKAIESNLDLLVYGNNFSSMYFPFDRFLLCPSCGIERKIQKIEYKFVDYKFITKCPCGYNGVHKRNDKLSTDVARVHLIRWSPHQIDLMYHPISGEKEYYWNIPADFAAKIKSGDQFIISSTPWPIIDAVKKSKAFKFRPGSMHHRTMNTLAGFNREWGIPPGLSVFQLYWYTAILRRMNEAIANDFIVPQRIIFPQGSSANNDPTQFVNATNFISRMKGMVKAHRRDPCATMFSPIPVGYQAVGGEGKALDTSDMIKSTTEEILNSLGYPAELFYGTLSIQAMPAALRVFENNWRDLKDNTNDWLQWVCDQIAMYFDWDDIEASFAPVTLADDIERRQVVMQFAASQAISNMTALKQWNIDFKEEQQKKIDEQQIIQEFTQKSQEIAQEAQNAESGTGNPGAPSTVEGMQQQAIEIAQQMISIPDEAARRQQLDMLSKQDETLHALVTSYMKKMRASAGTQTAISQGMANPQQQLGMM